MRRTGASATCGRTARTPATSTCPATPWTSRWTAWGRSGTRTVAAARSGSGTAGALASSAPPGGGRSRLDDIILGANGKLWFLDDRGRVGLADPDRRVLQLFPAPGGRPSRGPSRLAAPVRGAIYSADAGVGRMTEAGRARSIAPVLPSPPGAVVTGPDGNLWVAARRGPHLYRVSRSGTVVSYKLDLPSDARLRDIYRDGRRGGLWIASARPRSLLLVRLPELRPKLR